MLSVFAGHGKHGCVLAELAATVVSRQVRRRMPRDGFPASSFYKGVAQGPISMERIVDDAFVEANIAVDEVPWARNSGATATVCLLKKGQLVVGTCGEPCVMLVTRRTGNMQIQILSDSHHVNIKDERDRVQRFGGLVSGGSVSDEEGLFVLPFTRSLGDVEMRSAGICQVPAIRTFAVTSRDSHIIVSTQRLWGGDSCYAPCQLVDVVRKLGDGCMISMAEQLMKVAFGVSGPTHDATILCAKLR